MLRFNDQQSAMESASRLKERVELPVVGSVASMNAAKLSRVS